MSLGRRRCRRGSGSCPGPRRRSAPAAPGCRRRARDRARAAGRACASASASRRRVAASAMSVISRVTTSWPVAGADELRQKLRDAGGGPGHALRRLPASAIVADQLRPTMTAWKRVRSVWVTMPTSRPPSTIGRWPTWRSIIVCSTSEPSAEAGRATGSARHDRRRPACRRAARRPATLADMSRRVTMPTSRSPSTTASEEMWRSRIMRARRRGAACAGRQVSGRPVISVVDPRVSARSVRARGVALRERSKKRRKARVRVDQGVEVGRRAARAGRVGSVASAVVAATPSRISPRSPKELRGPSSEIGVAARRR